MTAVGGLDMLSTAFRVSDAGEVVAEEQAAPIAAPLMRLDEANPIDLEWALSHHLLLVGEEVELDELEALAISVWDEAGWAGPGMLRLGGQAALQGPWRIDTEIRSLLGTPADRPTAWSLICTPMRAEAPDEDLRGRDIWAHAFPDGMPVALELRTLLALRRMARRLAGSLRVAGSGEVMTPDPDSAVDLTVYAPRWIAPEDLLTALRPDFPTVIDSRDVPRAEPRRPAPRDVERIAAISRSVKALPPEIAASLAESRRRAEFERPVVDGYAVVGSAGNRSEFMIEVHRVPRPPQVLRWESWTKGPVVEYGVHWMPGGDFGIGSDPLTRTARLERARSTRDVERATSLVVGVVGGSVIDEDGFLVGLDAETV